MIPVSGPAPLDRRFLVVTGKGGVGKSTVAVAAARQAASRGRSVLLCDLDATGEPARLLGSDDAGYEPVVVAPGIDLLEMHTDAAMEHYLETHTPFGALARVGPVARGLALMGGVAPGVREVLAVGRLLWSVRNADYDLVIMDGPASGHVAAYLGAARSVGELASGGLLAGQTRWMAELLDDEEVAGAIVVTLPEPGPVAETVALRRELASVGVPLAGCVVNRMPPPAGTREQLHVLDAALNADYQWSLPVRALLNQRGFAATRQRDAGRWYRALASGLDGDTVWSFPECDQLVVEGIQAAIGDEW